MTGKHNDAQSADTASHLSVVGEPAPEPEAEAETQTNWWGLPTLSDTLTGRLEELHRDVRRPDA